MNKYYPPVFNETQFHCIHCGVFSKQVWSDIYFRTIHSFVISPIRTCVCVHCNEYSYWYEQKMIIPAEAPVAPAHIDMPESILREYNEARSIFVKSPRATAALLRLAIQKLMIELGEQGENINNDIKSLVSKGLPAQVQQAFDYCRVVGNNAVHPGEINLNDTPEMAQHLFEMINFIIEDRITRPKQIAALYDKLPEGARKAIEKRDS
ncbi:DUF4145 domain-containing protein [Alkanindiges illinoisensis]|uniref:DUF4145 domain-containing protein n=2 Tax=Alkanindiges illinoisensis TaxID=197183 RepID=A0A4Y7XDN2_9GAMM|nr:DUF4145 domain-containing protein [Alkanindiges illinoisensis]